LDGVAPLQSMESFDIFGRLQAVLTGETYWMSLMLEVVRGEGEKGSLCGCVVAVGEDDAKDTFSEPVDDKCCRVVSLYPVKHPHRCNNMAFVVPTDVDPVNVLFCWGRWV
jgi:hypothetical protein